LPRGTEEIYCFLERFEKGKCPTTGASGQADSAWCLAGGLSGMSGPFPPEATKQKETLKGVPA